MTVWIEDMNDAAFMANVAVFADSMPPDVFDRLIALARIGAAVKPIDFAVAIAFKIQLEQVKKRDQEKETSEAWQVYNHGVFIAGKIKDALAALSPPPEQQEPNFSDERGVEFFNSPAGDYNK